jgi:hypothetical protein
VSSHTHCASVLKYNVVMLSSTQIKTVEQAAQFESFHCTERSNALCTLLLALQLYNIQYNTVMLCYFAEVRQSGAFV